MVSHTSPNDPAISPDPRTLPGRLAALHYLSEPAFPFLRILIAVLIAAGLLSLLFFVVVWGDIVLGVILGRPITPGYWIAGLAAIVAVGQIGIPAIIAAELIRVMLQIETNTRQAKELIYHQLMSKK
jgi:uncharacterized RDD family membrane protein YckC